MNIWILCDPAEIKRASLRLNSESDCMLLARRTCAYDVRRKEGRGIELCISLPSFVIRFPLAFERQSKLLFVTISHFKTTGAD